MVEEGARLNEGKIEERGAPMMEFQEVAKHEEIS